MNANNQFRFISTLLESGRFVLLPVTTKICMYSALCLLVLQQPGLAQDATKPAASDEAASSTAAINIDEPSSHISADELEAYIASHSAKFAINSRTRDPFGQVQDTSVKKVIKSTANKGPRRFKPIKPTSFSEVIGRIRVNTIMPSEQKFLIGTRSFKQGDKFPIAFRGRTIEVTVIDVSAQKIDFENSKTGEVASLKISLLPAGMQSGTSGVTPPGMATDDSSAPLQVGGGNR